jgi:hypothetical protein
MLFQKSDLFALDFMLTRSPYALHPHISLADIFESIQAEIASLVALVEAPLAFCCTT